MKPRIQETGRIKKKNVKLLRLLLLSSTNHKKEILKQSSIKDAHIYCKLNNLSGQVSGPLLEHYMIVNEGMAKHNPSKCIGDCSFRNKNIEIKTSLGGNKNIQFNYVQLRLDHKIDYYLLTAYYLTKLNVVKEGELFIFMVPKESLKKIVLLYGQYAHGTIKSHGDITKHSMNKKDIEYAIRPVYNDECWKSLLPYRIKNDFFGTTFMKL